jgi:arabinofuranosyltransferase
MELESLRTPGGVPRLRDEPSAADRAASHGLSSKTASRAGFWEWTILAEVLVLAAYTRFRWADFDLDDSFITYAYAKSIAAGQGFLFAGQKVLGTTTPLYALLLGGLSWLGVPIPLAAKAIGLLSALAACILLHLLVREVLGPWAGLVAATFLAINARHILISMSGMETGLYAALCLAAFYSFLKQRDVLTACLTAAICLLRPDGVLLVLVLVAAHVLGRRKLRLAPILCFCVPVALWTAYSWLEFGSPVPTSITAKLAYPDYGMFHLNAAMKSLGAGLAPALLGLGIVGLIYLCAFGRGLLPLAAWTALYLLAFMRAPNFNWYYVPPIPGLIVVTVAGLMVLCRILNASRGFQGWGWELIKIASATAAAVLVGHWTLQDARAYRSFMDRSYGREVTSAYYSLGVWLREHTPENATVAVPEVGYVGYYSDRRILDLAGLCSPEVIPYLQDRRYLDIIRDFRPDYVALTTESYRPLHNRIMESEWFLENYRAIESFPYRGSEHYVVFGPRKDVQPMTARTKSE